MIEIVREGLAALFLIAGAAFFLIGAIGVVRMPEVFTRIHAASLCDTTGVGLILVGLMFHGGLTLVTAKLVFLLLFLMFMGPAATHALAAAALQAGAKPFSAVGGGKQASNIGAGKARPAAKAKKGRRR